MPKEATTSLIEFEESLGERTMKVASSQPLPVIATHVAGAILIMLIWWLDQGMPYTPEQMDTMFQRLVLPGVQAMLQGSTER